MDALNSDAGEWNAIIALADTGAVGVVVIAICSPDVSVDDDAPGVLNPDGPLVSATVMDADDIVVERDNEDDSPPSAPPPPPAPTATVPVLVSLYNDSATMLVSVELNVYFKKPHSTRR